MIVLAALMLALSLHVMLVVGRWNESARYNQGYDDGMTAQRNYDAGYIEKCRDKNWRLVRQLDSWKSSFEVLVDLYSKLAKQIPKRGVRGRFVGRK